MTLRLTASKPSASGVITIRNEHNLIVATFNSGLEDGKKALAAFVLGLLYMGNATLFDFASNEFVPLPPLPPAPKLPPSGYL